MPILALEPVRHNARMRPFSAPQLNPATETGWRPTADFFAQGFHGQFIYVAPEKQMVIVRFGRDHGSDYWWPGLMARIAAMN